MSETEFPVQIPLAVSKTSSESLQNQICIQLRERVADGRLKLGTRLTSIREMAAQLDVSLNTVRLAYQQLISEGYLETSEAKGTYVARALPEEGVYLPEAKEAEPNPDRHTARFPPPFRDPGRIIARQRPQNGAIDFWAGRTDPRSFPVREWRHLTNVHLQDSDANMTDYGDAAGLWELREAIADHLARARSFRPGPEQIVITAGIQEALSIAARLFLKPGATAVMEAPCYKGASYAFQSVGAELQRVAVDEEGVCVERIPAGPAALTYITPSHQYPMGHILSMSRRHALLEWAARSGAYILEDDYDSDFRFQSSPLPALASMDTSGCVIYLGTFSKVMGAGLRLGYMVLPPELVDMAASIKTLFSFSHPWLVQVVMADFIDSGDYAKRLRRMRQDRMQRRDSLHRALQHHFGDVTLRGLSGGMHVVWHLPQEMPSSLALQQAAEPLGIYVYSPEASGADVSGCEALNERLLVFGYASLSNEEIWKGIRGLASTTTRATSDDRPHQETVPRS